MIVWPFIVLTLGLTAGIGYLISRMEKTSIMKNWTERRCEVPIMTMASYFKPDEDPRTPSKFSSDNFEFCMDQLIKEVTSIALEPIVSVFSKQGEVAGGISDSLNAVRNVVKVMYDQFMSYITGFLKRYESVANQIRTTTLHLKLAFQRVNSVMLSTVFMGLSMMRGMLNTVDFVIKVVLIILGIMVALIIILFFILFPFMPILFSVIAAIVAVAVGSVAAEAASYRSGLCFSPTTQIRKRSGIRVPISCIVVGDVLDDGSTVESTMTVSGRNVPLWTINGILVSGSHLVQKEDGSGWHPVRDDSRAVPSDSTYEELYCLNTSSHAINILCKDGHSSINFRDWEELESDDIAGQYEWNYNTLATLNRGRQYSLWKNSFSTDNTYPSVSCNAMIVTPTTNKRISEIQLHDMIFGENMVPTQVIGIVRNHVEYDASGRDWATNVLRYNTVTGIWERYTSTGDVIREPQVGYQLITEDGCFNVINSDGTVSLYRDFTEVGYNVIEQTNSCVESRLRSTNKLSASFTELK